ncbi:MAG: site-specific integrase [Candidatus Binatia bacterium]
MSQRRTVTVHPYRRYYPFLLCLARTGLRLGEAIALKWGDVDWRGGFIHVQRSYSRGELSTPKSGKDRRVDMSAQLQRVLRATYEDRFARAVAIDAIAQAALEVERAAALDAWVFPDDAGGLIDESNFRHRIWQPPLTAAELRHIRLHDLQHTCASLLIAGGAELQYVQQQLGHHSPAFTLTVYGHLLPKDRRGVVDQLAPAGTLWAPDRGTDVLRSQGEDEKALVAQGL